jgi:two-component system, OmpR family, phosphate regulon sensor histidine kinase PhoR
MDFAIDLKVALSVMLLLLGGGALWAWARPVETQPHAAQRLLSSVFAHAPVAVLWLRRDGEVLMANPQARTLAGIGPTAKGLPALEWQSRLIEDVQAVLASPTETGRSRTLNLPEQRTWHWWVTAWDGAGLVFVEDVTTLQQAEQATHLLLSDLAHELRTPLATVATHLEVLRLPTIAPEIRDQSIQFLRDETQRLVRLVNNTLELGRLQSSSGLEMRPVQLFPLVQAVVAQLHGEAQANQVEVGIEAAANLSPVLGHADRLKQVLLNLLDNSIQYARPGDRVNVTLTHEPGGVGCSVCDNGPGIAAEHLPHVTRRFYRAVPSGIPGSGLGLALAAEIIRQHGAQLSVESRVAGDPSMSEGESSGTCVRFVLPAWTETEAGV